jgi:hypothetical protein
MPAALRQEVSQTRNTVGGITTWNSAPYPSACALGSFLLAGVTYDNSTSASLPTSVIDSAGQSYSVVANTYLNDTVQGQAQAIYAFTGGGSGNTSATALTVTGTWAAAVSSQGFWLAEITGVSAIIAGNGQTQTAPGTGAGAISTGTIPNGSGLTPNFFWGLFCLLHSVHGSGNIVPAGPSGIATGVQGWPSSSNNCAVSANGRFTTGTPYAATATDATYGASETYDSMGVVLQETQTLYQPFTQTLFFENQLIIQG